MKYDLTSIGMAVHTEVSKYDFFMYVGEVRVEYDSCTSGTNAFLYRIIATPFGAYNADDSCTSYVVRWLHSPRDEFIAAVVLTIGAIVSNWKYPGGFGV